MRTNDGAGWRVGEVGDMVRARLGGAAAVLLAALAVAVPASADRGRPADDGPAAHWTAARMAAATPRDLVVDERGLGYLRRADGSLQPHGHAHAQLHAAPAGASRPSPAAKPGGGGSTDATGPVITDRDPAHGATIGTSHTFSATVTDASGVRSVTFVIVYPDGTTTQSFAASANGSTWSITLQGFSPGGWSWRVIAKDGVRRSPNTTTSEDTAFTVGDGGGGGGSTVANAPWTGGGTVQTAAGRIYFEMPTNTRLTRWAGYVCSGTVAEDGTSGRSVIITAAHCVYDDVHKVFARNVLFIPDQDGTSGSGTDLTCSNDPIGCWAPSFGVVDTDWAARTFPDNIPWDYAFYVVADTGAHSSGLASASDVLDLAAGDLPVQVSAAPGTGVMTHALGYSYSEDPNLMYCAEELGVEGAANWWLASCGLSGGSSGGPWMQPIDLGDTTDGADGPIVSVNSWGYTNQPGMAGPKLSGSSAGCVFSVAKVQDFGVTDRGVATPCP